MLVFQCPDSDFLLCNDDEKILNFLLQVFQDHNCGRAVLMNYIIKLTLAPCN